MSAKCNAELCINWTGQGCICAVMGLGIEAAKTEEERVTRETCDVCRVSVAVWRVTNGGYGMRVCSRAEDLAEAIGEVIQGAPRVVVSRLDGE